jgi:hypothetical protein
MERDIASLRVAKIAARLGVWGDDKSWREIAGGSEMVIRSRRQPQVWRCLSTSALHCLDPEGTARAAAGPGTGC